MKKIIVKCQLKNPERFEKKITDINMDFSPIFWLHDRVYAPKEYRRGMNYPRLVMRTEVRATDKPAEYSLILRRHIEDSGVDVIETTVVKNYEEMVKIIFQLGFKQIAEVSRQRQEMKIGEGTMMYLDRIEDQPERYAKIETELLDGDSVAAVREDLEKTFAVLGEKNLVSKASFELD